MKRIWADLENSAEEFWAAVNEAADVGDDDARLAQQIQLMGQATTLELDDLDAEALLEYAAKLRGYSDGPDRTRCALIVEDF